MGVINSILGIASAAQPSSMTAATNATQGVNAGSAGGAAGTVAGVGATPSTSSTTGNGFGDVVVKALDGLQSVQDNADGLAVKAATGDLTDVHNYTIAASEANLAPTSRWRCGTRPSRRSRASWGCRSDAACRCRPPEAGRSEVRLRLHSWTKGDERARRCRARRRDVHVLEVDDEAELRAAVSNLSAEDAGSITNALSGMNVPYQLADGGATVLVPQANLYKARIDLATKGLPANSDGFALLDKAGITTSDFTQHVDYQRAVQTELANTIESISGVQSATVNLALPTEDPFVGDSQQNATAAVLINTGGVQMPQDNVQAIVHLVSASVENLSSSNITVSDTMGHLLYSGGQDSSFTSGQNMSETQSYEDGVRQQVLQQLNSVLGPGHAAVAVSATLDFTQGTSETTTNTPVVDKHGNPIAGTTSNDDT